MFAAIFLFGAKELVRILRGTGELATGLKVGLVSLGCPKNLVDSEVMLGQLQSEGFVITAREEEADILIVNTCAFISPAVKESLESILELARLKKEGNCRVLLVAGCLVQRYGKSLVQELPEVDGFLGTGAAPFAAELVKRALQGEKVIATENHPFYFSASGFPRVLATPPHTAYVKIAEGCSHHCSFCTIPSIRGPFKSRPWEEIIKEARLLAQNGVREIILVAQDTARYGVDLYGRSWLGELLARLEEVPELVWLRVLYCSPDSFSEEMIGALARLKKWCRYLDIPVQHASNEILRKMRRRKEKEEIKRLVFRLREEIPEVHLRTTFLVGFPGEEEKHFEELLRFMEEVSFERAGVFKYCPEEGTPAAGFSGQVPEKVKEERYRLAMTTQKEICRRLNRHKIGKKVTALVEGKKDGMYFGRTEGDAPEVDGKIFFAAGRDLQPGDFVPVLVKKAGEYDLMGELADEHC